MKSVGESMAIGRTFKEAFQKALRALENGTIRLGKVGSGSIDDRLVDETIATLRGALRQPTPERIFQVKRGFPHGHVGAGAVRAHGDRSMVPRTDAGARRGGEGIHAPLPTVDATAMRRMKRMGFSDRQLGDLRGQKENDVRAQRWALGVRPVVQDGRHLRRRISVGDAVSVQQLRRGERSAAKRKASRS